MTSIFYLHLCLFHRYIAYFEQYVEYDPFFTPPELPNPWQTDNPELWDQDKLE